MRMSLMVLIQSCGWTPPWWGTGLTSCTRCSRSPWSWSRAGLGRGRDRRRPRGSFAERGRGSRPGSGGGSELDSTTDKEHLVKIARDYRVSWKCPIGCGSDNVHINVGCSIANSCKLLDGKSRKYTCGIGFNFDLFQSTNVMFVILRSLNGLKTWILL